MKFIKNPASKYVLGFCNICTGDCKNRCNDQCFDKCTSDN
jgi:hypothetical protein